MAGIRTCLDGVQKIPRNGKAVILSFGGKGGLELVAAVAEVGNWQTVELGPTVHETGLETAFGCQGKG